MRYKPCKAISCHTPFIISQPLSIINWGIRKITQSKIDHAFVLLKLDDFDNKWFLLDGVGKGMILKRLDTYLNVANKRKRKHFETQEELLVDMEKLAEMLSRGYKFSSYLNLLCFCTSRRWFGENSKIAQLFTTETNNYKYVCFEATTELTFNEQSYDFFERVFKIRNNEGKIIKPPFHLITGKEIEKIFKLVEIDLNSFL